MGIVPRQTRWWMFSNTICICAPAAQSSCRSLQFRTLFALPISMIVSLFFYHVLLFHRYSSLLLCFRINISWAHSKAAVPEMPQCHPHQIDNCVADSTRKVSGEAVRYGRTGQYRDFTKEPVMCRPEHFMSAAGFAELLFLLSQILGSATNPPQHYTRVHCWRFDSIRLVTHITSSSSAKPPERPFDTFASCGTVRRGGQEAVDRDDVRRFLSRHDFTASPTHFSSVAEIYSLYLQDSRLSHSAAQEERFRSALGRVLRPPQNSGAWAMTFAVPQLKRRRGFISIVSPSVRSVDPHVEYMEGKARLGQRLRTDAKTCANVARLREERQRKAQQLQNCPCEAEPPQKISFRYVDEFMGLTCASDLCSIKVGGSSYTSFQIRCTLFGLREHLTFVSDEHRSRFLLSGVS